MAELKTPEDGAREERRAWMGKLVREAHVSFGQRLRFINLLREWGRKRSKRVAAAKGGPHGSFDSFAAAKGGLKDRRKKGA